MNLSKNFPLEVWSVMRDNNFDDSLLDREKLQEAYKKVDRMFGIDSRGCLGSDKHSVNKNACWTNIIHSSMIKPCLLFCLMVLGILAFVLVVVFLDDIYLLFNHN